MPGNHDVKRRKKRSAAISDIKGTYLSHHGVIPEEDLEVLDETRREYLRLYQQICTSPCPVVRVG